MDEIVILPFDPNWKKLYKNEELSLSKAFQDEYLGIMHIGSTSIEGLEAKPIIDISIGLKCLNDLKYYKDKLDPLSYTTKAWVFDNGWVLFAKEDYLIRYHLHLMPFDSMRLFNQVLFKIFLELNPEIAQKYVAMKHYYVKYDDDIWYSMNKKPFVKSIEKIALEELIANPEKWKKRVYDVMGYLPHDYLFRLFI